MSGEHETGICRKRNSKVKVKVYFFMRGEHETGKSRKQNSKVKVKVIFYEWRT